MFDAVAVLEFIDANQEPRSYSHWLEVGVGAQAVAFRSSKT